MTDITPHAHLRELDPDVVAIQLDEASNGYVNKWDLPLCNLLREAAWLLREMSAKIALQSNVDRTTIRPLNPLESHHHEEGTPHT